MTLILSLRHYFDSCFYGFFFPPTSVRHQWFTVRHQWFSVKDEIGSLSNNKRRRLRKHHLKSEFALPQTLSRLFHLVEFVKCWQIFLQLNFKGLYQSSRKEKEVVVLCSRPRQNVKLGTFSRPSRATTATKCIISVMHVQKCCVYAI